MQDDRSPIVREALRWFALSRDDAFSDKDRLALERWRGQSAAHEAAWQRACQLWSSFAPVETELRQKRRQAVNRRVALGAVAGMALAGGAGGYFLMRGGFLADFQTGPGERRRIDLADGSSVDLNSSTALSHSFTATERRLVLHRGEAFFSVAADSSRPFTVAAGNGEVRALGTQFDVNMLDGMVTVSVLEHRVELGISGQYGTLIEEGWQGGYGDGGIVSPSPADLSSVEAWRHGRLVYHDVPLRRVLMDFERHRGGFIVLTDERLGRLPVTASFELAGVDAALDTIAASLPMTITRLGALVVVSRS